MSHVPHVVLAVYVIASIFLLGIIGMLFVILAITGVLSAEVRTWVFWDWYLGWGLIVLAATLAEAVMGGDE